MKKQFLPIVAFQLMFFLGLSCYWGVAISYAQNFEIKDRANLPIPGTSAEKAPAKKTAEQIEEEKKHQAEQTEAQFVDAMRLYLIEDYPRAQKSLETLAQNNETNAGLAYQLALVHLKQNNLTQAISFGLKAYKLNEQNTIYGQFIAGLLAQEGKYESAAEIYKKLFDQDPDNTELGLDLASCYYTQGQYGKAINVYEAIEKSIGLDAEIVQQKQNIYLKLGKINDAIKEGDRLIEAAPTDLDHYLNQAEICLKANKKEKAEEYLAKGLKIKPESGQIYLIKADQARIEQNYAQMFQYLDKAIDDKSLNDDFGNKLISSLLLDMPPKLEEEKKLNTLKKLVEKQPDQVVSLLMLGTLYAEKENYSDAKAIFQKVIGLDKKNNQAWLHLIETNLKLNDLTEASKYAQEAIELYPNQAVFWYMLGFAQYQQKSYEQATENLLSAANLSTESPHLQVEVQSLLGEAYRKLKMNELSDEAFEAVLKIDPNNDPIANNYAFYLSLRKERLDQAEKLAKAVVDRNPENATFLDTYGWVLYQMEQFDKAKEVLAKAVKNSKEGNFAILDHYGDVLFKADQKSEALNAWSKALLLNPKSTKTADKIAKKQLLD
jgi:tetratricopeptide (TPR) repeat protein